MEKLVANSHSFMSLAKVSSQHSSKRELMNPSLEACLFLKPRVSEFQS